MTAPVVVVGGGVIGLTTAHHLRRRGADVLVLEGRRVGAGASWGNAGWLVPSLAAPLAAPGMVGQALRSLAEPSGAFRVRPTQLPWLLPWLLRFARSCSVDAFRHGLEATARLAAPVMDDYDELAGDGVDFLMDRSGLLFACLRETAAERARLHMTPMRAFGVDVPDRVTDGDELRAGEPALSPAVRAGFRVEGERAVHPGSLLQGLLAALLRAGADVREHAPVTGFEVAGGRVRAVLTPQGRVPASAVVVTAGAWSGRLSRQLGAHVPVQAGTGCSFSAAPAVLPKQPLYLVEARAGTVGLGDGRLRIAGTMSLTGVRSQPDVSRLPALARASAPYLASWDSRSEREHWSGMRPMTPDGLPVIGALPSLPNAYVSTGHAMLGMTLGPTSGRALATLVLDGQVPEVLRPFDPSRFGRPGRRRVAVGA